MEMFHEISDTVEKSDYQSLKCGEKQRGNIKREGHFHETLSS